MPGRLAVERQAPVVHHVVPVKSVAAALLLTVVWLGAGHLYANRAVAGALLMSLNLFLMFLSLSGVSLVVSVVIWCLAVVVAMVTVTDAVHEHNQRAIQPRPVVMPF